MVSDFFGRTADIPLSKIKHHAYFLARTNLKRQPNHPSISLFFFNITNFKFTYLQVSKLLTQVTYKTSSFENFEKEKFQCKAYFDILNVNFLIFIICTIFGTIYLFIL